MDPTGRDPDVLAARSEIARIDERQAERVRLDHARAARTKLRAKRAHPATAPTNEEEPSPRRLHPPPTIVDDDTSRGVPTKVLRSTKRARAEAAAAREQTFDATVVARRRKRNLAHDASWIVSAAGTCAIVIAALALLGLASD